MTSVEYSGLTFTVLCSEYKQATKKSDLFSQTSVICEMKLHFLMAASLSTYLQPNKVDPIFLNIFSYSALNLFFPQINKPHGQKSKDP